MGCVGSMGAWGPQTDDDGARGSHGAVFLNDEVQSCITPGSHMTIVRDFPPP